MRKRWKWMAIVGAAGAVSVAAGAWAAVQLPSMAVEYATRALEGRTGMEARIERLQLRFRDPRMGKIVLQGRHGGVRVELSRVAVTANAWDVLWDGTSAIRGVSAERARVRVDLTQDGARRSLDEIRTALKDRRSSDPPAQGDTPSRPSRTYGVDELDVLIADRSGKLLRMEGARATRSAGRMELDAGRIRLGASPADRADLHDLSVVLRRIDGTWRLSRGTLERAQVVWAKRDEDADFAPARIRPRIRGLMGAMRGHAGSPDRTSAGDAAEDASSSGLASRLKRIAPDARLELQELDIHARTSKGKRAVLADLEAVVRGRGNGRFRTTGSGTTGSGGTLQWDLELEPLEPHLQGTVSFERVSLALVAPLLPDMPWHQPRHARLDGELVVRAKSASKFGVEGSVTLRGGALQSPRIAPDPVAGISFTVQGKGVWLPLQHRLRLDSASLQMGEAALQIEGALEWTPDHYVIDAKVDLPSTPCNAVVHSIPSDLLGKVRRFRWKGAMSGHLSARIDSRELGESELELRVHDRCDFDTVPSMADLRKVTGPFVHRVEESDDTVFEMTTGPGTANWTPIEHVSPYLVHAVLAHEDADFFEHHGFAPWAIRKALIRNLREQRFVQGASTITMQLAKNLFLHREKTLVRKIQEVILAWWLETALDKVGILELYLNIIEYGPDIYGIRNASQHYFGREPSALSVAESVFLACILPDPRGYHDIYEQGALTRSMKHRMKNLLEHMHTKERIDEKALEHALTELETFSFHPEGAPAPEPRDLGALPGEPGPLPEGVADGNAAPGRPAPTPIPSFGFPPTPDGG